MNRCDITDLLVDQCAHCRCPNAPTPPDPTEQWRKAERSIVGLGPWFRARYDGACKGCGARVNEGDLMRSSVAGFVGECCGGEP